MANDLIDITGIHVSKTKRIKGSRLSFPHAVPCDKNDGFVLISAFFRLLKTMYLM